MNNKLKCASFFAGVGGIDLGFESTDCLKLYMRMKCILIQQEPII